MTLTTNISRLRLCALTLLAAAAGLGVSAQNVEIKTNLVGDALLSPSVAVETRLAPRWSLDFSGQFNFWNVGDDKRWRHWVLQPELRYWFCTTFSGHFIGAHLLGGQYNIGGIDVPVSFLGTDFRKLKDSRYQGWFGGVGVAYGYDWIFSRHWTLEAEIGFGWTYTRFDRYPCAECGKKIEHDQPHHYIGPTKVALNLIYAF